MVKDLFSEVSSEYRDCRPNNYPSELFAELISYTPEREIAYDCGTGNGQFANHLVKYFSQVLASDFSEEQIAQAQLHPRINYFVCPAEVNPLPDRSCDLISVMQAVHWFDRAGFYREAQRLLKSSGILVLGCYGYFSLPQADKPLQRAVSDFLTAVAPYWPPERKLIDEKYQTISFPFREITIPEGRHRLVHHWNAQELIGYLATWSSTQKLVRQRGTKAIAPIYDEIARYWFENPTEIAEIVWPLYFRVGRK